MNAVFQTKAFCKTCFVLLVFAGFSARTAVADVETYRSTLRSTTWVLAKANGETSSGAGVLVDAERKLIVTNAHVVGDARAAVVFFPDLRDGHPIVERNHYLQGVKTLGVRGTVVAIDRKRDLALVQLDRIPEGMTAIPLAADSVGPGEEVQSIGNPGTTDALWVFTSGTVRSVYPKTFTTGAGEHKFLVVETQVPVNSGDSGGPLVNQKGELVAITQAISPKARLVSYSVDVSEVKAFLAGPWKSSPLPVTEILTKADLTWKPIENGPIEVTVERPDKSIHTVFVSKETEYFERADVRRIWTVAATLKSPPSYDVMLDLLQQSAQTKIGSWIVEKTPQGQFLVIYCAKIDATAAPDAVRSTVEYVGQVSSLSGRAIAATDPAIPASKTLEVWLGQ